jgi:hypothetical protein
VITVVEQCTKHGWYWYVLNQSGEILVAKASARTAFELAAIAQEVLTHQDCADRFATAHEATGCAAALLALAYGYCAEVWSPGLALEQGCRDVVTAPGSMP